MRTLKLHVEELEQRIAPDVPGTGDTPPDNRMRPPFFIMQPPVEYEDAP